MLFSPHFKSDSALSFSILEKLIQIELKARHPKVGAKETIKKIKYLIKEIIFFWTAYQINCIFFIS